MKGMDVVLPPSYDDKAERALSISLSTEVFSRLALPAISLLNPICQEPSRPFPPVCPRQLRLQLAASCSDRKH